MKKNNSYNKSNILKSAWRFYRANKASNMSEAFTMAWANAKAVKALADANGEIRTYSGWQEVGKVVRHGEICKLRLNLYACTKSGKYMTCFFTPSQVCDIDEQD